MNGFLINSTLFRCELFVLRRMVVARADERDPLQGRRQRWAGQKFRRSNLECNRFLKRIKNG